MGSGLGTASIIFSTSGNHPPEGSAIIMSIFQVVAVAACAESEDEDS